MTGIQGRLHLGAAAIALAAASYGAAPARAADIVADWPAIQMPPPPTLKPATLDPKTTALLLFDFMNTNCNELPRCVETIPRLKALMERARAAGMLAAYNLPRAGYRAPPAV